jgi:hypothetical protein
LGLDVGVKGRTGRGRGRGRGRERERERDVGREETIRFDGLTAFLPHA